MTSTSTAASPVILHVDMDAFYASVEQRDDPALRGKPVIVGGTGNRGVVSAASYEARVFGVRSAMPTVQARRLCPQGIFVRGRMSVYMEDSRRIHAVLERYSPDIEPLALDEAFLDLTGSERLLGPPAEVAARLKAEILDEVGLVASVGVAPSKYVAKLASDIDKPDGLVVVQPDEIEGFLHPLPVERLWGAGAVTVRKLRDMGLTTIGDVAALTSDGLEARFGQLGSHLWRLARGLDERRVVSHREPESIGHEETFDTDYRGAEALLPRLLDQSERVASRLRSSGYLAGGVRLKIKYSDFQLITRQRRLSIPTDDGGVLYREVADLLRKLNPHKPVRLSGVAAYQLCEERGDYQLGLFTGDAPEKGSKIGQAMDAIRERFGSEAVLKAEQLRESEAPASPARAAERPDPRETRGQSPHRRGDPPDWKGR